jgi:hypothetical protein
MANLKFRNYKLKLRSFIIINKVKIDKMKELFLFLMKYYSML